MSKKKKRKRSRKPRPPTSNVRREDFHHLLFQRKHWQQGMAKVLREHPYCGGYIPQATLHREIHSKVHDVPTPNASKCRRVLNILNEKLKNGEISVKDRLDTKAKLLAELFLEDCPATAAILLWQSEIISKFYGRQ